MNVQPLDHRELLRQLHHSVKSPLTSISNLTEMLLLGIDGELSLGVRQDVQTMSDDTQRLQQAVEKLLDLVELLTTN